MGDAGYLERGAFQPGDARRARVGKTIGPRAGLCQFRFVIALGSGFAAVHIRRVDAALGKKPWLNSRWAARMRLRPGT